MPGLRHLVPRGKGAALAVDLVRGSPSHPCLSLPCALGPSWVAQARVIRAALPRCSAVLYRGLSEGNASMAGRLRTSVDSIVPGVPGRFAFVPGAAGDKLFNTGAGFRAVLILSPVSPVKKG